MNQMPGGILLSRGEMKAKGLEKRVSALEIIVAKLSSSPNTESPKLLCPKCGSHVIHYSYLDQDNWCDDCHFRWDV